MIQENQPGMKPINPLIHRAQQMVLVHPDHLAGKKPRRVFKKRLGIKKRSMMVKVKWERRTEISNLFLIYLSR